MTTASAHISFVEGPRQALSLRIPSALHFGMKAAAKSRGVRMSDLYAEVISRFVEERLDQYGLMFAAPTDSMPVSVLLPKPILDTLRRQATERHYFVNEIVLTALAEFLGRVQHHAKAA